MLKTLVPALALSVAGLSPTLAQADDAPPSDFTITGSAAVASQYRLRGISQTDNEAAIQGGVTVAHASGVYVGTWASNLGGYGTFGGSNMELDAIAGFTRSSGAVTFDLGGVYYIYPGAPGKHEFAEIYGSVSGKLGPVSAKLGTYFTPRQKEVGGHNIWVYTDWAFPIADTPITLKAHAGYSDGNSGYTKGLDAGGKSRGVFDYAAGADLAWKNLTLNLSYVGTDIKRTRANLFWAGGDHSGRAITRGNVVATLTAAF
jgi:uncharacterized protein (TIGR02001 family)